MRGTARYGLVALVAFAAALAAVLVARAWIAPEPRVESEVHALIHQKLELDAAQVLRPEQAAQFDAAIVKALTRPAPVPPER